MDMMTAPRRICFTAAALLLAACVSQNASEGVTANPETPAEAVSSELEPQILQFQQWLDEFEVPFAVPQSGKSILVNVPGFELVAFSDGMPVLRSRVIVGTPWNPSPIVDTYTTAVRIRPTWRPTPEMVRSGEYRDRTWPPGLNNPLGLLAVRLEPGLLVYLHDTNRRDLFDRDDRALSHGCIRVQRWDDLAAWLVDLDVATVRGYATGDRTFDLPLPAVPVFIGYYTAFPDDGGQLQHFPDIYGREPVRAEDLPEETPASAHQISTSGAPSEIGCPG